MASPPRKPKNPEDMFRRGMEQNIRSKHERSVAAAREEEERNDTAKRRFKKFLKERIHPSRLTAEDFEPGLYEDAFFFNRGRFITPHMMGQALFNKYKIKYAQLYQGAAAAAAAPEPVRPKKRSAFNMALNEAEMDGISMRHPEPNMSYQSPRMVHRPTPVLASPPRPPRMIAEPPNLKREHLHSQRYFPEEDEYDDYNNNAKSTEGFGQGGRRTRRHTRKQRRTQRKRKQTRRK